MNMSCLSQHRGLTRYINLEGSTVRPRPLPNRPWCFEIRPGLSAHLAPGSQVPVAMSWAKSAEKHVKFPQTASSSRSSPSNPIPARSGVNSAFTPHGLPPKRPFRNQGRSQAMHVTFSQVEGTSSMTWSLPPWSHQAACWICGFPGPARWDVNLATSGGWNASPRDVDCEETDSMTHQRT